MNVRVLILGYLIAVIPNSVRCMDLVPVNDISGETSPMDIDPNFYTDLDQRGSSGVQACDAEQIVEDLQHRQDLHLHTVINFPINNIAELTFWFGLWFESARDRSPDARRRSLEIASTLTRGIEKLYKQNPCLLADFIEKKRQQLNPEQQRVIDMTMNRCRRKVHGVMTCSNSVKIYTAIAMVIFVFFAVVASFSAPVTRPTFEPAAGQTAVDWDNFFENSCAAVLGENT